MNITDAVAQIQKSGIKANGKDVERWIEEGKIIAERSARRQISYSIKMKDLADFIIQEKEKLHRQKLEGVLLQVKDLKGQIEILNTRVQIEESKVKSLKKMVQAQKMIADDKIQPAKLLGLKPDEDLQIIRKEFKKLLKALHPDRGGDERLFKVFNEHYKNIF
ncbi:MULTISPECIES: J domain-containing protein [unclassified Cytobacillus]|uniref:J domain-containing protein n=1 Tax=unclassified Cytobacillus TaxID=2675268 RepID=UPI00204102C0|nr:J domain-containing protein [Cytobacillus sp. AMY 15.2]MCM3092642.1 J domain-containing protein [Cytobacillus sp. AMY 15.2]